MVVDVVNIISNKESKREDNEKNYDNEKIEIDKRVNSESKNLNYISVRVRLCPATPPVANNN